MAYIRTQIVDDKMYYLLLDEVQMLDCFESVLNGYLRKDNMDEKLKNTFRTVKKSKITSSTIKKYLDYFEDSFLIESAQRYDIKGKAYIETPKKSERTRGRTRTRSGRLRSGTSFMMTTGSL